jgi:hypothetical protein
MQLLLIILVKKKLTLVGGHDQTSAETFFWGYLYAITCCLSWSNHWLGCMELLNLKIQRIVQFLYQCAHYFRHKPHETLQVSCTASEIHRHTLWQRQGLRMQRLYYNKYHSFLCGSRQRHWCCWPWSSYKFLISCIIWYDIICIWYHSLMISYIINIIWF